jgi:hypothetical protein
MTPARKILLASLVAPSATTLVAIVFLLIPRLAGRVTWDVSSEGLELASEALLWLLGISYALCYTAGIPIYLVLRRLGWRTRRAYMGGAALMGIAGWLEFIVVMLAWAAVLGPEKFQIGVHMIWKEHGLLDQHNLVGALAIGLIFTPIGLAFWLITRPDISDRGGGANAR